MAKNEIGAVRALLAAMERPVGWAERRKRLDDVGSVWPIAADAQLGAVDVNSLPGEYSSFQVAILLGYCCFSTAVAIAPVQSKVIVDW